MKIAILTAGFPPMWIGGTEIATYNMAKYLSRTGHEIHVITSLDKGLPREYVDNKFYVHRVRVMRYPILTNMTFALSSLIKIYEINPDILHCQSIFSGIAGFSIKKVLKIPYIIYGRGSDVNSNWILKNRVSRITLGNADSIVALSSDMKEKLAKIGGKNICIIPNGIDLENYGNQCRNEMRNKMKIRPADKIIIYVGRLHQIKGIEYLIKALEILKVQSFDFKLLVVGYGDRKSELEKMASNLGLEDEIIFVGKVPNSDVPKYLSAADIFVLPSLSEGFPTVILEAMASGLPIIATNVGAATDIIENGKNGFLVEPKDSKEIAHKILSIFGDKDLYHNISLDNREKAKIYDWKGIVKALEIVYLRCLKQ